MEFSFFNKENAASVDQSSAGSTTPVQSVASASAAQARGEAERELGSPTRRRRRSSSVASDVGVTDRDLQEKVNAAIASQLEALHSPEAWAALGCLPADAALTWTGKDRWKVSEQERKTVGLTLASAARTFMITNPRALACSMAAAAMVGLYMPRVIAQLKEMREEAEKKKAAT